jgi:hypothetical protein
VSGWLRALGAVVLVLGLGTAAVAGWHFTRDTQFAEILAAYERHPEHALFQADYWLAAARHYGLLALGVGGLLFGLAAGSALLGLGEVLHRLPRR